MNGDGLCGAWEVLMLRPIESLLLLQLGCMIKCHLSRHPLTPTYRFLSISHCLSLCYSSSEPCCLCYLVLFFSPLCQLSFHFFPPFHLSMCPYLSVSFPSAFLCTALSLLLAVIDFATFLLFPLQTLSSPSCLPSL